MARVTVGRRSGAISQVAPIVPKAGQGWAALSSVMASGAEVFRRSAEEQMKEEGIKSVSRSADGSLNVDLKNPVGPMTAIHNAAALASYSAQRGMDISQNLAELAQKYEFDPAGFQEAANAYVKSVGGDEGVPAIIRADISMNAQNEASRRFNSLYGQQVDRDYAASDNSSKAKLSMLSEDYVSLYMGGDLEGAEEVMAEMEGLASFRANAPYISDTEDTNEAYFRGIRSAAKAARLGRQLDELGSISNISDEMRGQIDEALADPDLKPEARAALYAITQGLLKKVDARAFVDSVTSADYASKVSHVESGGKASAKNPNSSAYGPFQFTKGTWAENVHDLQKNGGAQWANGLSEGQLQALRADPEKAREVFDHFRAKNAQYLSRNGIAVTDDTEYLAHFLGAGGAVTVLKSDPLAMVSSVLPDGVMKANPFLSGMTVADMKNWAARKMAVKASDISMMQTQLDVIENEDVRSIASQMLNEAFSKKRIEESYAQDEYQVRVAQNDTSLTEDQIWGDHSLSDDAQVSLVNSLQAMRKDQIEITDTIGKLNSGAYFDVYDNDTRTSLDKTFEAVTQATGAMSDEGMRAAYEVSSASGYLPKGAFTAARSALNSGDPDAFAQSAELLNMVLADQPGSIAMHGGNSEVQKYLDDYGFYSGFMGGPEAAQRVIDLHSPEGQASRKNLADAAKAAVKNLKVSDIEEFYKEKDISVSLGSEVQQGEMMGEYERFFRDAFVETGDHGLAKNRALNEMSRVYGPNGITGDARLMKYPPQHFYPMSKARPNWMRDQIAEEVSAYAFGDDAMRPNNFIASTFMDIGGTMKWVQPERIKIISDNTTRREVSAGRAPSYQVYFDNDGVIEAVPGRFYFDPTLAQIADLGMQAERQNQLAKSRGEVSSMMGDAGTPAADEAVRRDFGLE